MGLVTPRPDPPRDLNGEEAIEWCKIVASMPPNYFAGSHYPLLAQLCRHTVVSRQIAQLIAVCRKQKNTNIHEYAKLLGFQLKQSSIIMHLSRSMRLTHQSIYRADSTKQRPVNSRPLYDGRIRQPWDRQQ